MTAIDELATRLRTALDAIPRGPDSDGPGTGRRGAVLALLCPPDGDLDQPSLLYTRRQDTLSSHPGQISFPGGRVDDGETLVDTALREAEEEVALRPDSVEVLGRLPAFYIPPSRFWMSTVVGVWRDPHPLEPHTAEVAQILRLPLPMLAERPRLRAVPLSVAGRVWAWALDDGRLLWGATAAMTGVLLDFVTPGWSGGLRPEDLTDDEVVKPWESAGAAGRPRARLGDVAAVDVSVPEHEPSIEGPAPTAEQRQRWAAGVAEAVTRLRGEVARRAGGPDRVGPTVVLVGRGTIGRVGQDAAALLAANGFDVEVHHADDSIGPADLQHAGVIVDALVGRGLRGRLADPLLSVVRALREVAAPIVAVDLPSGLDPRHGVVGEAVSADVTVTDHALVPGHVAKGSAPMVADLYVVTAAAELRRAEVAGRPTAWGE